MGGKSRGWGSEVAGCAADPGAAQGEVRAGVDGGSTGIEERVGTQDHWQWERVHA